MKMSMILFCIVMITTSFGKICDNSYQCSGEHINDAALCDGFLGCSQAIIDGPYAECNGYYACYNSEEITASIYVHCYGSYGCYNSNKIKAVTYIECHGHYSCAFTTMNSYTNTNCTGECSCRSSTISSGNHVICDGKQSCAYGELLAEENIYCYGRFGCEYSAITANKNVYVYGHYGAAYSTISAQLIYAYGADALHFADLDSSGQQQMDVYSWGYQSGLGAHFICRSGSICNLNCIGNGCFQMIFICLVGSTCNIEPVDCVSGGNINGIDCPVQSVSESLEEDSKLMDSIEKGLNQKKEDREVVSKVQLNVNNRNIQERIENSSIGIKHTDSTDVNMIILLTGVATAVISSSCMYCYLYRKYRNDNEYKLLN
eukprot:216423_1